MHGGPRLLRTIGEGQEHHQYLCCCSRREMEDDRAHVMLSTVMVSRARAVLVAFATTEVWI